MPKDILMLQNMGYLDMFVFFLVKNARLDILQHIKDDNKVYSNFDIKLPHDNGTPLHYAIIMHARESNPQLK